MTSFEVKMTRAVSVKRSMKKNVRGCGGPSCQVPRGRGSAKGWKGVEEGVLNPLLEADWVQR